MFSSESVERALELDGTYRGPWILVLYVVESFLIGTTSIQFP